jgi:hypothetical protein
MKKLLDKVNVEAASSDYPYGRPKNNTGTNNGTPVDLEFLGDYVQFFEHIMNQAAITPNGLPDNVTNGFQLFEAFLKVVRTSYGPIVPISFKSGLTELRPASYTIRGGVVYLSGSCSWPEGEPDIEVGGNILSAALPVGARPLQLMQYSHIDISDPPNAEASSININTDGTITKAAAEDFAGILVLDGICYPI